MVTYIVTVTAKKGHEQPVADFYLGQGDSLNGATGFAGRKIYRARTGAMVAAVKAGMTEEQRTKLDDAAHEEFGTRFILIENWASIDDRMAFAKNASQQRMAELIPHLLPEHTHEFYEELV